VKLTKSHLKQLIKEEIQSLLEVDETLFTDKQLDARQRAAKLAGTPTDVTVAPQGPSTRSKTCIYKNGRLTGCSVENNYDAITELELKISDLAMEVRTHAHRR